MNELNEKVKNGLKHCQTIKRNEASGCGYCKDCPYIDVGEIQSDCMGELINDIYKISQQGELKSLIANL